MAETDLYSGFFICRLPDKKNGHNWIKVACFQSGTSFRKVLSLATDDVCKQKYGAIVRFWPKGLLQNNSLVKLKDKVDHDYIHDTTQPNRIIHEIKQFHVGLEDLEKFNCYRHPDFGDMDIKGNPMVPGSYNSLVFEVLLQDNDSFILQVRSTEEDSKKEQKEKSTAREEFEAKMEVTGDIWRTEKVHDEAAEAKYWNQIGYLELKKLDDSELVGGIRAIFKLVDGGDENKVEMFSTRKDVYPVYMRRQSGEEGNYQDDPNGVFEGTLFERKNGLGGFKPKECIVQLKRDDQKRFYLECKTGDVYRFESRRNMRIAGFYDQQKQTENEIYQLTLDETLDPADPLKLQDVIDSHMLEPAEFENITDKNTPKNELNESQLIAVKMALNDKRPLVCIQGPPGTGKSHTLAILVYKIIKMKKQAIVLTPTKEALKNLRDKIERLCGRHKKELKLHPYAFMDISTYHQIIDGSPEAAETLQHFEQMKKDYRNGDMSLDEMWTVRDDMWKTTKTQIGGEILKEVRIIFATIESSFPQNAMRNKSFNPSYCIIDEAAQVMETQTWPAVGQIKKIVMAGDPKQLPALVLTKEAKDYGLEKSVMERIISKKEHFSWITLDEQYRCHKNITEWSNGCFYNCKLINQTDNEDVIMRSLKPKPKKYPELYSPMVLVDTSMVTTEERVLTYERLDGNARKSYINHGEAKYAMQHYENLIRRSIDPATIAIIAPYKGQVELLKKMKKELAENIAKEEPSLKVDLTSTMVGTIDSVQGQEYDIVIFTFVRSNPQYKIGFVGDLRRLNVVVTRAKRHFMLIANAVMLQENHHAEIRNLLEFRLHDKLRFHPNNLTGAPGQETEEVKNNFGYNLESFIGYSNDEEMIKWCHEWVKKGRDPVERAKREQEKAKRMVQKNKKQANIRNTKYSHW